MVRSTEGRVEVDATGKKAGRGAYLCRSKRCWELALKKKALEHALQTSISPEDREGLTAFIGSMPEPADAAEQAR